MKIKVNDVTKKLLEAFNKRITETGITKKYISEVSGISYNTICDMLQHRKKRVSFYVILQVAIALEISIHFKEFKDVLIYDNGNWKKTKEK